MKKFKVGDIVEAIGNYYRITNFKNKWVGRVTYLYDNGRFDAETISSNVSKSDGMSYDDLDPGYFKLVKKTKNKNRALVSNQATILFDENGDKYVSKCSNEEFDIEKGIMMCLCKKHGYTYEDIKKFLENTEYKEVKEMKCKATVGDYIKIVSPMDSVGHYKKGDILKVINSVGVVVACEGVRILISDSEYVVLKGYKPK